MGPRRSRRSGTVGPVLWAWGAWSAACEVPGLHVPHLRPHCSGGGGGPHTQPTHHAQKQTHRGRRVGNYDVWLHEEVGPPPRLLLQRGLALGHSCCLVPMRRSVGAGRWRGATAHASSPRSRILRRCDRWRVWPGLFHFLCSSSTLVSPGTGSPRSPNDCVSDRRAVARLQRRLSL